MTKNQRQQIYRTVSKTYRIFLRFILIFHLALTPSRNNVKSFTHRVNLYISCSVTSQTSVIPEEMEYPDADMSPKEDDGPVSIKEAFTGLMKADKSLHNKVLTYEPLPLEVLHLMLKAEGFKFKKNDLMDFLDEQCITFQVLGQSGKSRTKKTRGKKGSKQREKSKPAENLDSF